MAWPSRLRQRSPPSLAPYLPHPRLELTCLGAVVLTLNATLSAFGLLMTSTFLTSWVKGPIHTHREKEEGDERGPRTQLASHTSRGAFERR